MSRRLIVLAEVNRERDCQEAKWGQQNHPDGTGDDVSLMHGNVMATPTPGSAPTMGTLAYVARSTTDEAATKGTLTYADILLEEVGEALAESDPAALRNELVQVAAVAVAWIEKIDRGEQHDKDNHHSGGDQ